MTTARTHRRNVGRGGAARPRVAEPKPDGFTAISAETFGVTEATPAGVEEVEGSAAFDPSTLDFDPADHNSDEVKAYVSENPDHAEAVLELEENGKARSGVMSFIENLIESEG